MTAWEQRARNIELIRYQVWADLRSDAERSYLGVIWWIIEPIIYLAAFYVLLVLVLHRGTPDFVAKFLCGAVVWKWFDSGIKASAQAIVSSQGVWRQVRIAKYVFTLTMGMLSTARFVPVFFLYLGFLLIYGCEIRLTWIGVVPILLVQLLLILSLGMLIGSITPFLPDLSVGINHGMMFLFFISGVFFDVDTVAEPVRSYLLINPMAVLIKDYRNALINGIWPGWWELSMLVLICLVMLFVARAIFNRLDGKYAKMRF